MDYILYMKGNIIVYVLELRKINFDDFLNIIKLEKGKCDFLKFCNWLDMIGSLRFSNKWILIDIFL